MSSIIEQVRNFSTLKRFLGWSTLDELTKNKLQLETLMDPPSGRVLVLAPHPDDDIYGCGGVIAKHIDQGDEVRIVYLCDGRSGSKRHVTELVRDELKKTRRAEATEAAEVLGVPSGQLVFWAYRDGQLKANATTVKALAQILSDYMPRIIYAPHPSDQAGDHEATAKALAMTLQAVGDYPGEIWSYEVHQPVFANRLVQIQATMQQKETAIRAHKSQLERLPYLEAIRGLNDYRGAMAGLGAPAEAFLMMKPKLYLKVWELLRDFSG